MATTIKLKNSVTTTAVPSTLVQGEAAVNITDKKVWVGDASSSPVQIVGAGAPISGTTATISSNATVGGTLGVTGAFSANGGATLGDASGDALTINSSAVSIPNGLNFDSNTFVIDAANNRVGVGTASPSQALDITASGASAYLSTTNGTVQAVYGTSNGASAGLLGTFSNHPQVFWTNNAERMRITSTGAVGIGTASPSYTATNRGNLNIAGSSGAILGFQMSGVAQGYVFHNGTDFQMWNEVAGTVLFATNALERMRIDSSGNVGIGTSSPNIGGLTRALTINTPTGGNYSGLELAGAGTISARYVTNNAAGAFLGTQLSIPLVFETNATERMRIDSSGRLLIRTTTGTGNEVLSVHFNSGGGITTTQGINILDTNASANGSSYIVFRKSDEVNIGTITRNGTSNAVLYNTTSDYRLKENVQPLSGALEKVFRLRPVTWKWKDCDANGEGFIAHEVQEIVPSAVTGQKDAVDENGKPDYQGMDASYLVATLTAAIQEQQAIINDLTNRITQLENK